MLNSRDLTLLRDDVEANCRKWLELCKEAGLNVLVTNTVRDAEYQAHLYAQGRTRPGSIVTNSKLPTFHSDQAGLAFDFCKNVKGHEYDDNAFFHKAAAIAKGLGFSWGGDWKSFVDMPHIQWDNGGKWTSAMIRAGKLPPAMPLYNGAPIKTTTGGGKTVDITLEVLKRGAKGDSVKALQILLNGNGCDCGTPDGSFGPATQAAVRAFQSKNKLSVDGAVGAQTWTALLT